MYLRSEPLFSSTKTRLFPLLLEPKKQEYKDIMPEQITHLEGVFYMIAFCAGFLGALVLGVVIYDIIDRNKRRIQRWRGIK